MIYFIKSKCPGVVVIFAMLTIFCISCKKESTTPNDSNLNQPVSDIGSNALALTTYNGNLIVGYSDIVAQWNGSSWSSMGIALNGGSINALTVYNGNLIAAGGTATATNIGFVKMWNGSSWQSLGTGFGNTVNALIVYNGNLIAGGLFDSTYGGCIANYIAQWNGSSWQKVGPGFRFYFNSSLGVYTFTIYNGNLVAGGNFYLQGAIGIPTGGIAQWNGSVWSLFGKGVGGGVKCLTVYNGNLIAGGSAIDTIGTDSANYIAQWNGTAWSTLGNSKIGTGNSGGPEPTPPTVLTLTVYNNNLIVGGGIFSLAGASTYGLAEYNAGSWSLPFGNIVNNEQIAVARSNPILVTIPATIFSSTVYNGNLIIGGGFNSIGGITINGIAQWNGSSWSAL